MDFPVCSVQTDALGRELATHGTPVFPVGVYRDDLAATPSPWHWHEELELVVVRRGAALCAAGAEKYTVQAGDGVFVNAGVLHGDWPAAPGDCLLNSVVFHPRLVGGSMDSVFWQQYLQPLMADTARSTALLRRTVDWQCAVLDALEEALDQLARRQTGYEFRVREALSRCVFLLYTHAPAGAALPRSALRSADRSKTMLQFIHEHFDQPVSVPQIAASASISVTECLRCFRDVMGTTPNQYLRQYRAQRAAELLSSTSLRVGEVAARCGFADANYFARCFRQMYGMSPADYRKKGQI